MSKRHGKRQQYEQLLQNPNVKKFLDLISYSEGTQKHGYATAFGGNKLSSLNDHPRYLKSFKQQNGKVNHTSAAGRYQFLKGTWDGVSRSLGLKDFGGHSQDLGALKLLDDVGALGAVVRGDYQKAVMKAGNIWASFPTAPDSYSQPKHSWQKFHQFWHGKTSNPYANARQSVVNQASQYANFYRANRDSLGFSQHSLAQLDGVHGDLGDVVALAKKIIKQKDPNLTFQITEGMRSQATQNKYLSKGKTKVKVSKHQHGGAIDVVAVRNGKSHYNFDDYYVIADAMAQASSQLGMNVRWGGSWSTLSPSVSARDALASYKKRSAKPFLDAVHFELADLDQNTGRYVSRRLPVAMGGNMGQSQNSLAFLKNAVAWSDLTGKQANMPTTQNPLSFLQNAVAWDSLTGNVSQATPNFLKNAVAWSDITNQQSGIGQVNGSMVQSASQAISQSSQAPNPLAFLSNAVAWETLIGGK